MVSYEVLVINGAELIKKSHTLLEQGADEMSLVVVVVEVLGMFCCNGIFGIWYRAHFGGI